MMTEAEARAIVAVLYYDRIDWSSEPEYGHMERDPGVGAIQARRPSVCARVQRQHRASSLACPVLR